MRAARNTSEHCEASQQQLQWILWSAIKLAGAHRRELTMTMDVMRDTFEKRIASAERVECPSAEASLDGAKSCDESALPEEEWFKRDHSHLEPSNFPSRLDEARTALAALKEKIAEIQAMRRSDPTVMTALVDSASLGATYEPKIQVAVFDDLLAKYCASLRACRLHVHGAAVRMGTSKMARKTMAGGQTERAETATAETMPARSAVTDGHVTADGFPDFGAFGDGLLNAIGGWSGCTDQAGDI